MTDAIHQPVRANPNFQRLSVRLAANLAVAGLIGFGLILFFVAAMISARFEALENAEIEQHIARTERMLVTMKHTVRDKSLDWGLWTATYDFITDGNQGYRDENLGTESFFNLGVDAAAFVGMDGVSRFTGYYDFEAWDLDPDLTREFEVFATAPENTRLARETEHFQGFMRMAGRLFVVSFSQIKVSDTTGEPNGYLVFATELKPEVMSEALQVQATYALSPMPGGSSAVRTDDSVHYAVNVPSVRNAPIAAIEFETPRDLKKTGQSLLTATAIGIATLLFAMIFLLNRHLGKLVTRPLAAMEKHVSDISQSGELKQMQTDDRKDEIGKLTTGFNEMTHQLSRLRSKLEVQSYQLGQTQNSIDIMHNVRNGLSPIGPILSNLASLTDNPQQENVAKAIEELGSQEITPDRRSKMVSFLQMAFEDHVGQMTTARSLIGEADQSVAAAVTAIEQTQRGSDISPEVRPVVIRDLIDHNLTLARFARNGTLEIITDALTPSTVDTNHILFGQVLNNILSNATESINATDRQDGRITFSGEEFDKDGRGMLRLLISDNGEGFDPEMATRLFERGYSTRADRTGGLGLHWSANTLKSLDGSLSITSEGKGRGACVEILLPLSVPTDEHVEAPEEDADGFSKAS